jgi:F0F1-type ATP synthase alpha subunit
VPRAPSFSYAGEGYLDDVAPEDVPTLGSGLSAHVQAQHTGLYHRINHTDDLGDETRDALTAIVADYCTAWRNARRRSVSS